jgi:anti-sigma factor RsiW
MTCRECADFLMEYLEGGLLDAEREVFEAHLRACPPCVVYLDTYRETVRMGREVCGGDDEPAEVPEALVAAVLATRAQRD